MTHVQTDGKPVSKRCNDVRIYSACSVLVQSRFPRHTFSQLEIWLDQIQWKCDGQFPRRAVCAKSDNRKKILLRFVGIKYNAGPNTISVGPNTIPI